MPSKIAWTDEVWNPVTGCTKVSAGCANCYAERIAKRYWGTRKFTDVRIQEGQLKKPLKWTAPRRVFVNSMSDLFHAQVGYDYIDRIMAVVVAGLVNHHVFQVLTKRPERMLDYIVQTEKRKAGVYEIVRQIVHGKDTMDLVKRLPMLDWPPPNLWLGVSAENQEALEDRVPILLQTPARVRWASIEPMLGPVDLIGPGFCRDPKHMQAGGLVGLDWVVVGGESGTGHRPMEMDWLKDVVVQCRMAGVPVFVKQDSNRFPGRQGNIPDSLWIQEFPKVHP